MKNVRLTTYVLFLLLAISCGVPQAKYDQLKEENEKLKKEITECKFTPAQILDQATTYYDEQDYTKSRERLKVLIAKYANSNEGKKGKGLLRKVEGDILKSARANVDDKDQGKDKNPEKEESKNKEKDKKALSKMKKKYDINDDVTWYTDKSSTKLGTKNYIQAYVGKKEKKPWLGLSINYFSKKKWLFIERIEVIVDGKTFEIEEDSPGEFKSKEESGGKREWLDRVVKKKDIQLITKMASGKAAMIKFVGKDDIYKRTISKTEKKALQNVLDAFVALGGKL